MFFSTESSETRASFSGQKSSVDLCPCSGANDDDELFLLPESVLGMDSISFREDVASIAPNFIPNFRSEE